MTHPWIQTDKLKKLNLRQCVEHKTLFSAKDGGQCKKCAGEPQPAPLYCKHGNVGDCKKCAKAAADKARRAKSK